MQASVYMQWPDYLVLVTFLVISLGIGLYHALTGGRQKTTTEFIMANRSLGVLPTAISLLVSFESAIGILGTSAEMYHYGVQYLVMASIVVILAPALAAAVFVPWMHSLKLVSINEYLARRYQARCVPILGSCISMCSATVYMGMAMLAPSVALQSVTGFPVSISIPLMAVVSVAYTSLGGMRAVIWTDVFQFGIMIAGLAAVLIKGIVVVGGVSRVYELCLQEGRLDYVNWDINPTVRHSVWTFLIGGTIAQTNLYALTQTAVQRYSATESVAKGRRVILWSIPGLLIIVSLMCTTGLVVFSYFADLKCDPLRSGQIYNSNQLLPYFVLTIFSSTPGFTGLFLATLYGALSGASANLWSDVLKWKLGWLSDFKQVLLNRFLVVMFGCLATGMAFSASVLPGTILQIALTLNGSIVGPLCALFLLGGFTKFANWKGAVIGAAAGLTFNMVLCIGSITTGSNRKHPILPSLSVEGCSASNITSITHWSTYSTVTTTFSTNDDNFTSTPATEEGSSGFLLFISSAFLWFFSISYLYYVTLGVFVTFTVGSIASLICRDREAEDRIDDRLLIPIVRRFFCTKQRRKELAVEANENRNNKEKNNDNERKDTDHPVSTKDRPSEIKGPETTL